MSSDKLNRTELHYAALENNVNLARKLLENGFDPNAQDKDGFASLHFAAQEYAIEVADLLLEKGAKVDIENKYGNTPLFIAVYNSKGRSNLIKLLLKAGADKTHTNKSNQSPLGLAELIANYDVLQFFEGST